MWSVNIIIFFGLYLIFLLATYILTNKIIIYLVPTYNKYNTGIDIKIY